MTHRKSAARNELNRLADSFVDDILNMTDAEVLAEVRDLSEDPDELAAKTRELLEGCVLKSAKAKLVAAREELAASSNLSTNITHLDRVKARRDYEALLASDSEIRNKLTLAARSGRSQSTSDIESAIEDLAELGAFENDKGNE